MWSVGHHVLVSKSIKCIRYCANLKVKSVLSNSFEGRIYATFENLTIVRHPRLASKFSCRSCHNTTKILFPTRTDNPHSWYLPDSLPSSLTIIKIPVSLRHLRRIVNESSRPKVTTFVCELRFVTLFCPYIFWRVLWELTLDLCCEI